MAARSRDGGILELPRRFLSAAVLGLACCRGDGGKAPAKIPGEEGPPLVVEVLNASARAGSARVGTRMLRAAGIDVVNFGNAAGTGPLDSTRIVVRRGTAAVGQRVRQALGAGIVTLELDSAKLLDVSVFLGRDFSPRVQFHP